MENRGGAIRPARFLATIPDAGRRMGINLVATRGSGKTRLLSRAIIRQDVLRGIPTVVLDPLGACVDNVLDVVTRLHPAMQAVVWPRLRLLDTAGTDGRIIPSPLYLRRPSETLYDASQPFLDTIRRIDPHLVTASIQGWNALFRVGTAVGIFLAGLGLQITEAEDLLQRPEAWASRLRQLAEEQAEARPAVAFLLTEYAPLALRERQALAASFLGKVAPFAFSPSLRAMFGASVAEFDWQEVLNKSLCVFLDFRHETSEEMLRFKLVWFFRSLVAFIKARGPNRGRPLSLVLDEITFLLPRTATVDLLTADMEELINRLSRNNNVWFTASYQELYQLPEGIRKTFLTLGTQIIGPTTDRDAALLLARRFHQYDPYLEKKREAVYTSHQGLSWPIDWRTVEFSKDEQDEVNARRFLNLPKFSFLLGTAVDEGTLPTRLRPMSITRLDPGQYVNAPLVAQARELLIKRDGRTFGDIEREITTRRARIFPQGDLPAGEVTAPISLPPSTRRRQALIHNDTN